MWSEKEKNMTAKFRKEILDYYETHSRVPFLSVLEEEKDSKAPDFQEFGKRLLIPRDVLSGEHLVFGMARLAQGIVLGEFQYLIDTLIEKSKYHEESQEKPTPNIIGSMIGNIIRIPDYMIAPLAFHRHFRELEILEYRQGIPYLKYHDKTIRILWSNKFIHLMCIKVLSAIVSAPTVVHLCKVISNSGTLPVCVGLNFVPKPKPTHTRTTVLGALCYILISWGGVSAE